MYAKIVLHGADFSNDAVNLYEDSTMSLGGVSIVYGTDNFGNNFAADNRSKLSEPTSIFVPKGGCVVLKGLKNKNDDSLFLLVDGVLYSSEETTHANAIHSINGDHSSSDAYFPLNSDGDNEITWVNPYNDDYYVRFTFKQNNGNNITLADYNISYIA